MSQDWGNAGFEHGTAYTLAPGLRRITAPNAGVMTGPGTNTYLIGDKAVAVIDPGPPIQAHADAILAAVAAGGGELTQIFTTHTHADHSPCTRLLLEHCQAEVIGATVPDDGFQDPDFRPDRTPQHDECFELETGKLRAIYSPGHVDNHFCYLEESSGLLLTGDHIMQGSTVVIIPPAGDMRKYIDALRAMLCYPVAALGPGHGGVIEHWRDEIEGLIAHRLKREAKVIEGIKAAGSGSLEALVVPIYDDVDVSLHPVASFSLWAHLLKLRDEGKVNETDGIWHWLG